MESNSSFSVGSISFNDLAYVGSTIFHNLSNDESAVSEPRPSDKGSYVDFKTQLDRSFEMSNQLDNNVRPEDVKKLCFSMIETKIQEFCQNIFKESQTAAVKGHFTLKQPFFAHKFDDDIFRSYGRIKDVDRLVSTYMQERYEIQVKIADREIELIWNEKNNFVYSKTSVDLPRLPENQIVDDFDKLRQKGKFMDFTFIIGDQERQIHRAFFVLQIPGFEEVFQEKDKMQIENVTIKAFDLLLNYIYGHKNIILDILYTDVETIDFLLSFIKLYACSQLEKLRKICEWVLIEKLNKKITEREFKEIYTIAKKHELGALIHNCELIELKKENIFLSELEIHKLTVVDGNSINQSHSQKMKKSNKKEGKPLKPY